MGQAKRRGTFEQRKAEAEAAGRKKRAVDDYRVPSAPILLSWVYAMGRGIGLRTKKFGA